MQSVEEQYLDVIRDIQKNGFHKVGRNGGTLSNFGYRLVHDMNEGFPLITTKKMSLKNIAVELCWFLSGSTNIKDLVKQGCNIWVGDCYKRYKNKKINVEQEYLDEVSFTEAIKDIDGFAQRWGDIGPGYGYQWRQWRVDDGLYEFDIPYVDQISNAIRLLENDPDSRRILVSAWNVSVIDKMLLPPCHFSFQFYTRELTLEERCSLVEKETIGVADNLTGRIIDAILEGNDVDFFNEAFPNIPKRAISLQWHQRSADWLLGVPYNLASYGLLLSLFGKTLNMVPEKLIGTFGDSHIYDNQLPLVEEQLKRQPFLLPVLEISKKESIFEYSYLDLNLKDYEYHPIIKYPLSN